VEPSNLDYRTPGDEKPPLLPDSPAAVLSLAFAPFALVVDLILYAVADASGRQSSLGPMAMIVIGFGVIGIVLGVIGIRQRGHRKVAALFAIPLHLAIAVGFVFMLGSLA
jgi:hypothetical protein